MDDPPGGARYVQGMFARIAPRYDLMNRLMTAGQDVRWRRTVVRLAALPPAGRLLDLGAGTGDIAFEALRSADASRQPPLVVCGDFTLQMMRVGRRRPGRDRLLWAGTDALHLPFPDCTFDAVASGFLLRNVMDVERALSEQYRVLRPGGRVVCLDTTPPPRPEGHVGRALRWRLLNFHLHTVIPLLGRLVSGQADAYTYLPDSTEGFLPAGRLAEMFSAAGFCDVRYNRLMFGAIAIHRGRKPG